MKIVYGVVRPDAGRIFIDGREVGIDSPAQARALGIAMVFQHFVLFDSLTLAENVALGLPPEPLGGAVRTHAGAGAALRPRGRSGQARARSVGGRAAARRDPACADDGATPADPRRTDLGAEAAGDRAAVRHAGAPRGRRRQRALHQPQARRDSSRDASLRGAAWRPPGRDRRSAQGDRSQPRAADDRRRPAGDRGPRLAARRRRASRHRTGHHARGGAAALAARPRPRRALWRDRRHRRCVGQRPGRADGRAVG